MTADLDGGARRQPLPRAALLSILYTRILTNMSFRILYPFLPAIARGMGVSLTTAGQLASIQGGVRMLAPAFGHLSDRHGRRRVMVWALMALTGATLTVALTGSFVVALAAFAVIGMARALFDPTVHAYVGDAVPYADRGRPFAVVSMAWALSWLIGVPLSGLLIERWRWNAPWAVITLLLLTAILAIRRLLPPAGAAERSPVATDARRWWRLLQRQHVRAAVVAGFGIVFAVENVLIVYGAFLEERFALSVGTIGVLSIATGASELAAEGATFFWTDRLGKKRSVMLGLSGYATALLVLPLVSGQLVLALLGFALVFFCFEFTIVSFFPLMSEIAPDARAAALSMNVASMGLARLIAPSIATLLFARSGNLLLNAGLSLCVCLLTLLIARHSLPD